MLEPLSFDVDTLASGARLANLSIVAHADALSNLASLYAPGGNRWPVRRLAYRFSLLGAGRLEELTPLVSQFYPAYQETIWGTEGLILTQRLFVPYATAYEGGVCWLIEVQAEGPRVLQVEVQIETAADSLTVRDGLLVAVMGGTVSGPAVVLGSTGPPTHWEALGAGRARLFYHVLIEGEVEQPFVLAAAEAGVSLAWNGFLMLIDTEQVFRETVAALDRQLAVAHVYTPDALVNRGLIWARVSILRAQQRYRWGHAVAAEAGGDRVLVADAGRYALGANWLTPDFVGRLLDFLGRYAVNPDGGLAAEVHAATPGQRGDSSVAATVTYLAALWRSLLASAASQGEAVSLTADPAPLVATACAAAEYVRRHAGSALGALAVQAAAGIVHLVDPTAAPPGSAADEMALVKVAPHPAMGNDERLDASKGGAGSAAQTWRLWTDGDVSAERIVAWLREAGAQAEKPPSTTAVARGEFPDGGVSPDPGAGAALLALAVEGLLGLQPRLPGLAMTPRRPADWPWLAVSRLPYQGHVISVAVLDGVVHSTANVASPGPVEVYDKADIIPGDVFAILFQRSGTRRLFVAADEARTAFVRVGDRAVPVQLQAGEARLIAVE